MKKELDEALCAKYPEIFRDRNASMQVTCMCWGFECGDGWYKLLDDLCGKIKRLVDAGVSPPVVATQVKEKYGTLRFYVNGGCDIVDDLISRAESMSGQTCEICGKYGRTRGIGWLRTTCIDHADEGDLNEWELKRRNNLTNDSK